MFNILVLISLFSILLAFIKMSVKLRWLTIQYPFLKDNQCMLYVIDCLSLEITCKFITDIYHNESPDIDYSIV